MMGIIDHVNENRGYYEALFDIVGAISGIDVRSFTELSEEEHVLLIHYVIWCRNNMILPN